MSSFDRGAAARALDAVDLSSCAGVTGAGHIQVTFGNDGSVTNALIDQPPFANTATGACIADKFKQVHVPPFEGKPVTVGKSFTR